MISKIYSCKFIRVGGNKLKLFEKVTIWGSLFLGVLLQNLGGGDILLKALLTLIVLDYITGVLRAVSQKQVSSMIGFNGICKKVMVLLVLAVSVVIESIIEVETPIREITIMFFIANESISILENASEFIPIPEKLKDILLQIRGRDKS